MQTFHQFDYDTESFDADAALEFILNHYAFTDINLRGEAKRHYYISLASEVVDHLKLSHHLRAYLKMYKVSSAANLKLSIGRLIFGFLSGLPLLYFILTAHMFWLLPALIVLLGLFIIFPVFTLGQVGSARAENIEAYLTDIHHIELQIYSTLTQAFSDNSIDMVTMRLDYETFKAEHLTPISIN